MKKLWILLVALAMLGAVPLFASDVTISGELMNYAHYAFGDGGGAAFPKVELNLSAAVDDFNTVQLELDSEGGIGPVAVDDFRLNTDLGAALGLPISVKGTFGYFDTYFTGWYYYDASGWTWYYDWDNLLVEQGPDTNGAMQLDIGLGPANLHWYNDFGGQDFMVGVDAAFAGLSAWLAYGSTFQAFGDGEMSVEAAYNMMLGSIDGNAGVFFRYDLGASAYTYGLNLGVGAGMFHVAAGLEGDDVDAVDNIVAEVKVTPLEPLTFAAAMFMDVGGTSAFTAVDLGLSYMVGAAKLSVGYVIGGEDGTAVPVVSSGDNYSVAEGLYFGVYVAY